MGFDYAMIGKRIRQSREQRGLTQEYLAEKLSVSNAYISKIERGKTSISLDRLSEISAVLEQPAEYLLSGADRSTREYLRSEIMTMLEGCSPAKIKLIANVIRSIVEYEEK